MDYHLTLNTTKWTIITYPAQGHYSNLMQSDFMLFGGFLRARLSENNGDLEELNLPWLEFFQTAKFPLFHSCLSRELQIFT